MGIRPHVDDEVTIRPLRTGDDMLQVARLIYLTDPYIYPYWFDSLEQGQQVIAAMMTLPTVYRVSHITVAVLSDGFVAGMVVACPTPFVEHEEDIHRAFSMAGVPVDARSHTIFEQYYAKMGVADQGLYIANIAVDPNCRHRGIAAALLSDALRGQSHCSLDCVQANTGAWRLYQRLGFSICEEYKGVFDVPCFHLEYRN